MYAHFNAHMPFVTNGAYSWDVDDLIATLDDFDMADHIDAMIDEAILLLSRPAVHTMYRDVTAGGWGAAYSDERTAARHRNA